MFDRLATDGDRTSTGGEVIGRRGRYDERGKMYARKGNKATRGTCKGAPHADTYYTARMPSGEWRYGVTDSQGRTKRYQTGGAQPIKIYFGRRQEA
ncbi:PAAR domain-containing protein [Paraburkholderia bannensis]|uniref:hypothetical protein n=1 Tax=Paraburkholderia bannensis TaxID=765414 RepID=UPI002ABD9D92|nr:hypothetical protein [Paraburkholderia bannensis]